MTAPRIAIPEPEGIPAVKVTLDRPGMFFVCAGDPEEIGQRITDWLVEDGIGRAPLTLQFTDVKFGTTFWVTAHALRSVTSWERTYVVDASARLPAGRVALPGGLGPFTS